MGLERSAFDFLSVSEHNRRVCFAEAAGQGCIWLVVSCHLAARSAAARLAQDASSSGYQVPLIDARDLDPPSLRVPSPRLPSNQAPLRARAARSHNLPTFIHQPENRVVGPTVLTTVRRRPPRPSFLVGPPLGPYGLPWSIPRPLNVATSRVIAAASLSGETCFSLV
jgi:hypothetical protein